MFAVWPNHHHRGLKQRQHSVQTVQRFPGYLPAIASSIAGPQKAWTLSSIICVRLCCQIRFHSGTSRLYASMSTNSGCASAVLSTTSMEGAFSPVAPTPSGAVTLSTFMMVSDDAEVGACGSESDRTNKVRRDCAVLIRLFVNCLEELGLHTYSHANKLLLARLTGMVLLICGPGDRRPCTFPKHTIWGNFLD